MTAAQLALVGLGGAVGAAARALATQAAARLFGAGFPWGTLIVNVVGALLIGALAGFFASRVGAGLAPRAAPLLVTGVLGGFTTFSAFALDAVLLAERGRVAEAGLYMVGTVAATVLAAALGLAAARSAFG